MQISSTRSGLYPARVPSTPTPGAVPSQNTDGSANSVAETGALPIESSRLPQQIPRSTGDVSRALVSARQRAGLVSFVESSQTGYVRTRLGNEVQRGGLGADSSVATAAQRAVAQYRSVASQEQRFELTDVFGLDVFA